MGEQGPPLIAWQMGVMLTHHPWERAELETTRQCREEINAQLILITGSSLASSLGSDPHLTRAKWKGWMLRFKKLAEDEDESRDEGWQLKKNAALAYNRILELTPDVVNDDFAA